MVAGSFYDYPFTCSVLKTVFILDDMYVCHCNYVRVKECVLNSASHNSKLCHTVCNTHNIQFETHSETLATSSSGAVDYCDVAKQLCSFLYIVCTFF